jgi:hypothetical protein
MRVLSTLMWVSSNSLSQTAHLELSMAHQELASPVPPALPATVKEEFTPMPRRSVVVKIRLTTQLQPPAPEVLPKVLAVSPGQIHFLDLIAAICITISKHFSITHEHKT